MDDMLARHRRERLADRDRLIESYDRLIADSHRTAIVLTASAVVLAGLYVLALVAG